MTVDELFAKLAAQPPAPAPRTNLGQVVRARFPDGTARRAVVSSVHGYALVRWGETARVEAEAWKYGLQLPSVRGGVWNGWQTVGAVAEASIDPDDEPADAVAPAPPGQLPARLHHDDEPGRVPDPVADLYRRLEGGGA